MGVRAILRIMVWVIIMFVVCAIVSSLFYGGAVGQSTTSFKPNELFNLLLSAIPRNLFSPFVEGNPLQIAVESAFIGVCILALGEHSTIIRKLVVELNSLIFKMMYIFSKLLPALVFLTIFQVLTTTDVSSLKDIGLIVVVNFACVAAIVVGVLVWIRGRCGFRPFSSSASSGQRFTSPSRRAAPRRQWESSSASPRRSWGSARR